MEISVHVCILDGTPPQESDCYRTLCEILGERRANRWVDEVTFKPPDEVTAYVETIRHSSDPLGAVG